MPYYAETGRSRPLTLLARQNPTQILPCSGLLFHTALLHLAAWALPYTKSPNLIAK
jgi:hypothetical protein